jgi:2-polyprenyl-3-methyl-5-hydroxy-6-metoxy-1,4-benzoquinol methylase
MPQLDAFGPIVEIMVRHNVRCSPEEFHAAVNVAFHQNESEVYDEIHRDMWESLPREVGLLAGDCVTAGSPAAEHIRMLDIGCGTGLASDSMLKSALGPRIREITLLDTSSEMLKRARARADTWGVTVDVHQGMLDTLPLQKYDLIVTCSVLHHVPDVPAFLGHVRDRQSPGGVFIHIQDPNGETSCNAVLAGRMKQLAPRMPEWAARLSPSRIFGRLYRELTGKQGEDYISKTNRELQRLKLLTTPLSVAELFAITDIHVLDGQGISISRMRQWMTSYELISERSYGYFGQLASTLPPSLRAEENALSGRRDPNGFHIAGAWRLKAG